MLTDSQWSLSCCDSTRTRHRENLETTSRNGQSSSLGISDGKRTFVICSQLGRICLLLNFNVWHVITTKCFKWLITQTHWPVRSGLNGIRTHLNNAMSRLQLEHSNSLAYSKLWTFGLHVLVFITLERAKSGNFQNHQPILSPTC